MENVQKKEDTTESYTIIRVYIVELKIVSKTA
jgi:hypothetical protein